MSSDPSAGIQIPTVEPNTEIGRYVDRFLQLLQDPAFIQSAIVVGSAIGYLVYSLNKKD